MTTFHSELTPLVERAAVNITNKWPSYVSIEDVTQEVWAWVYQNQNSIETARRLDGWEAKVYSTMLKVASSAASNEDQQTNGYSKDDTYVYSVAVIETLLESVFQYEDWQSFGTFGDGQPHAKGQVNETGDMTAMLADVKAAMAEIRKEYREVLFYRFYMGKTHEQVGERIGITWRAAAGRHKRAIKALQGALGRVSPADLRGGWDNRREALGNEHARVITDRQYEG